MKTGWKDMYFGKATKEWTRPQQKSAFEKHHLDASKVRKEKKHYCKVVTGTAVQAAKKANANIGSEAEIAAYLARVPKPYHYVEGEES